MVTASQTVFLLLGDDAYLKEKALHNLRTSLLGRSARQSDQKIFRGHDLDPQDLFDQLTTIPLLSEKRLIIIKDPEEVPDDTRDALIAYIRKPSPLTYLVLDAESDSILDDYKEVIKNIVVERLGKPSGASLAAWIRESIGERGKTIDDDALLVLRELEGNDLSYLAQELDKLTLYVGDRKTIRLDDVEAVVGKSLILSAFDITDAVARKDTPDAIKICSGLLAGGKKEYELVGLLCWHLKRLLRAKTMKARGESDYAVAGALKIGRRFQDEFFRQLKTLRSDKIRSDIEALLQADLDIKRTKFSPRAVLEFTLIRLCLL